MTGYILSDTIRFFRKDRHMIEIKTQEDMMLLFHNDVIDKAISEFIGDYFKHLMNTFIDDSTA